MPEPQWEVVVVEHTAILCLRFATEEEARPVYDRIREVIGSWADYKNDRERIVTVTDMLGEHTFGGNDIKSVSIINVEKSLRSNQSMEMRRKALDTAEAGDPDA